MWIIIYPKYGRDRVLKVNKEDVASTLINLRRQGVDWNSIQIFPPGSDLSIIEVIKQAG